MVELHDGLGKIFLGMDCTEDGHDPKFDASLNMLLARSAYSAPHRVR